MALSIDNTKNSQQRLPKSLKTSGKVSIESDSFKKFYDSMQAERKTVSQLGNGGSGIERAQKNIDQAIDFSTKLMLAAAKNVGFPDEGGSSNKSKEMADAASSIAQMMATKASIDAQMQAIESQKNPAINLMDLKGKIVDYKDDTKDFFGEPVSYNYKISHSEKSPSAVVNLIFTVRDKQGAVVKTVHQVGKNGEHEFIWDGKDNHKQTVPLGQYTLEVKAEGKKTIAGSLISFPVKADAVLSGVAESVRLENGAATGVVVNGRLISRGQIVDVKDLEPAKSENHLFPDVMSDYYTQAANYSDENADALTEEAGQSGFPQDQAEE